MAKKSLSQNYLHDPSILGRIVSAARVTPGDTVLEIGPGPGALTRLLVREAGLVVAVEFDRDRLEPLIVNGWIGVVKTFESGLGLSFVIQTQNSEIKGDDIDDPVWGGFIVSRVY